jgi:hypothetical protein
MDMRFGTWNIRRMHRAGSLVRVERGISKYKLNLMGVHVRWDRGGNEPEGEYIYSMERGMRIMNYVQVF